MGGYMIEDFVFQGKECASLYSMKMYVDPNELESTLVCAHLISQFYLAFPPPPQVCAQVFISLLLQA